MPHRRKTPKRTINPLGQQNRQVNFPSLKRLYEDSLGQARIDVPQLLGVHECAPDTYFQPSTELFKLFGYANHKQQFWSTESSDYIEHAKGAGNLCGHFAVLSDGNSNSPVIFIMEPSQSETRFGTMMAVLFHELGHVDDFLKGVNIVLDEEVDMCAAEEYAHHFACKRILAAANSVSGYLDEMAPQLDTNQRLDWVDGVTRYYRLIMDFYVGEVLQKAADLPFPSVREAAQRVLQSRDMREYRAFATNTPPSGIIPLA